jgi:hypothetical protein
VEQQPEKARKLRHAEIERYGRRRGPLPRANRRDMLDIEEEVFSQGKHFSMLSCPVLGIAVAVRRYAETKSLFDKPCAMWITNPKT